MKYPRYLIAQYGGSSRKFEATHRKRLKAAQRALRVALSGCAFAPSRDDITAAREHIFAAIEKCRPANWDRK
jgi:hypothetical protein